MHANAQYPSADLAAVGGKVALLPISLGTQYFLVHSSASTRRFSRLLSFL